MASARDQKNFLNQLMATMGILPSLETEKNREHSLAVFQLAARSNGRSVCFSTSHFQGNHVPNEENIAVRSSRKQPTENPA
ncbi:uncharacterized protein [Porites lutea]|uniref:uncharacterized protein isoform X1 n=1 Tax=Porites lutea TaxID=51062 RepID=UPI003CC6435F